MEEILRIQVGFLCPLYATGRLSGGLPVRRDLAATTEQVRREVRALCADFPLPV